MNGNGVVAALLAELDLEFATTRRLLAAIPDDKLGWKPHEKSFSMAALAGHIVNLNNWAKDTLLQDHFDLAPNGVPWTPPDPPASVAALLESFDATAAAARQALAGSPDAAMQETWKLLQNGQVLSAQPRQNVLRLFILNHMVHHRGQLSVYLRLVNAPVPSIYGPSADEAF